MFDKRRIFSLITGIFVLKVLFTYCYRSTDFEVHRNWLAITSNLPIDQWYFENTSQWTLDYPPFFGWFEFGLAQLANRFDANITRLSREAVLSESVLVFQRLSVVAVDMLYALTALQSSKVVLKTSKIVKERYSFAECFVPLLFVANVGLVMVDSIHFQYNGLLFAMLLLSIDSLSKTQFLRSAFWFCTLLNFKHIFLYMAPAYGVYFLGNYCFEKWRLQLRQSVKLVVVCSCVFAVSIGPFGSVVQLKQLLARLFPFKRGLTHAYWAPNFWALYNFVDFSLAKVTSTVLKQPAATPVYTTGLVGDYEHAVLPNIDPKMCLVLTLAFVVPFGLLGHQNFKSFLKYLTFCSMASFVFGWHVHEKAVLMCIIPMTFLALDSKYTKLYMLTSFIGHSSLMPLLFTEFESTLKYAMLILHTATTIQGLKYSVVMPKRILNAAETWYCCGLIFVAVYTELIHGHVLDLHSKLPFVPLMLNSIYCSIGLIYCFLGFAYQFLCDETGLDVKLYKFLWHRSEGRLKLKLVLRDADFLVQDVHFSRVQLVGGLDVSTVTGHEHIAVACLAVLSFPDLKVLYAVCEHVVVGAPYVAGYLAWREADVFVKLLSRLRRERHDLLPQIVLVDGNGCLHPRGFGLACHVGVRGGIPTIGVAKNFLHCPNLMPDTQHQIKQFSEKLALKTQQGQVVGFALKVGGVKKPLFVSTGHNVDSETACRFVQRCMRYRVPEPVRQADIVSREEVRKLLSR